MLSGLQHRILVRLPADQVFFLISSYILKQISIFEGTIIPCLEYKFCLVWIEALKCEAVMVEHYYFFIMAQSGL